MKKFLKVLHEIWDLTVLTSLFLIPTMVGVVVWLILSPQTFWQRAVIFVPFALVQIIALVGGVFLIYVGKYSK